MRGLDSLGGAGLLGEAVLACACEVDCEKRDWCCCLFWALLIFCHALYAFWRSAAGSGFLAVGAWRGKFEKRSAPVWVDCGRCHVPGWVLRGGGGYAEVAWYGLPLAPVAAALALALKPEVGYRPALRRSPSYLFFSAGSPRISCAAWIAWNLGMYSSSLPALRSGWYCRASLRYCFLTSSTEAEVGSSRSASAGEVSLTSSLGLAFPKRSFLEAAASKKDTYNNYA